MFRQLLYGIPSSGLEVENVVRHAFGALMERMLTPYFLVFMKSIAHGWLLDKKFLSPGLVTKNDTCEGEQLSSKGGSLFAVDPL